MRTLRRTAFVAASLLITGSVVSAQTSVSIGVHIGPPPPPRVVYVAPPPPPPEPAYVWVPAYWYPVSGQYVWHEGYWTRPPYPGAHWVAARYDRDMFFEGYWSGPRGVVVHEHRWDHDHDRDFPGNGRGRGRGRGHR